MSAMRVRFSFFRALSWLTIVVLATSLAPLSLTAQQTKFQLTAVKFTGLDHYSEQEASLGSGLRIGAPIEVAQLQSASDRLAQSGAFDEISFRYITRGNELTVEFKVTETKRRLTCVFDNFIWFSQEQLDRTLRARIPFYDGTVPERGATIHQVVDALQAMLQSNGISATVDDLPTSEEVGKPVTEFTFRANGVSMPVRSLHIPGAAGVSEADLVSAASELLGKDYSASDTKIAASQTLLPIYHRHGYLQARFDSPQASAAGSNRAGPSIDIAVVLPVTEGSQYSWARATWSGNHQFSGDDLSNFVAMKPQEIANQDKIDTGLKAVSNAYAKQGYIDVSVLPSVTLSGGTRLVTYDVSVEEGIQYHMGQLHISGLADRITADLMKKWQLRPGQIYDGTYVDEFVKKIAVPKLAEAGAKSIHLGISLQRDKQNATVDVTIAFQ
jgi:outer membrane protein assembly factor BamA